ncbi:MAG: UDP-N-acetylmuramoyl-tripeptide--D-alanyl-D-alanine ligase [Exilispira sp.]|nr:UDP-N-acetylmuramoyl-tripeptide--D-alanyl-D-alanine ligase [Exilispira sp.]
MHYFFTFLPFFLLFFFMILVEFSKKDYLLHMAQLSNYRVSEFVGWIKRNKKLKPDVRTIFFSFLLIIMILLTTFLNSPVIYFLTLSPFLILCFFSRPKRAKKPLVYTKRAKRLKALYLIIFLFLCSSGIFLIGYLFAKYDFESSFESFNFLRYLKFYNYYFSKSFATSILVSTLYCVILIYITPCIMCLSLAVISPYEKRINRRFYTSAADRIERLKKSSGLKVIGITGSYGKTSTKNFLANILNEDFPTFASFESYNTPMGLSKVINENIDDTVSVFIAEMGARYKGDIVELMELCKPDITILTAVGPAHIETFRSVENIMAEKWNIVLPYKKSELNPSFCFINSDNEYIYTQFKKYLDEKKICDAREYYQSYEKIVKLEKADRPIVFTYGLNASRSPFFLGTVLNTGENGTDFTLKILDLLHYNNSPDDKSKSKYNGSEYKFSTCLLGKHNVVNILGSIGCGYILGISVEKIIKAVSRIEPVPHRLQLIRTASDTLIIDDAYNANPDSSAAALEVISYFKSRKKIIVTPGFIELGKLQYDANFNFGKEISKIFDIAIFVGIANKDALINGFESAKSLNKYFYFDTLDDATKILPSVQKGPCIILFENDLTDNY